MYKHDSFFNSISSLNVRNCSKDLRDHQFSSNLEHTIYTIHTTNSNDGFSWNCNICMSQEVCTGSSSSICMQIRQSSAPMRISLLFKHTTITFSILEWELCHYILVISGNIEGKKHCLMCLLARHNDKLLAASSV